MNAKYRLTHISYVMHYTYTAYAYINRYRKMQTVMQVQIHQTDSYTHRTVRTYIPILYTVHSTQHTHTHIFQNITNASCADMAWQTMVSSHSLVLARPWTKPAPFLPHSEKKTSQCHLSSAITSMHHHWQLSRCILERKLLGQGSLPMYFDVEFNQKAVEDSENIAWGCLDSGSNHMD